jgi:hypothetical protein
VNNELESESCGANGQESCFLVFVDRHDLRLLA